MKRREFITLLGGAAAAWPLAARAQQRERMRRIGVLTASSRGRSGMHKLASRRSCRDCSDLGWIVGRNMRIDIAGAAAMPTAFANTRRNWSRSRRTSSWLLAARPWAPLLQATRTVPIVFAVVTDPVGAGFVESLARPGGNATGFTTVRIRHRREMAGAAQADRAGRDASGGPSRSHQCRPGPASLAPSRPWRRRSGWS